MCCKYTIAFILIDLLHFRSKEGQTRKTQEARTHCDEAEYYVVPNVLSPRHLVSRPENMDETVLSSSESNRKTMNRNESNHKPNPTLKTKTGNK